MSGALVELGDVRKAYARRRGAVFGEEVTRVAVDGVSLAVGESETVGIVGESGSGKTTLARLMAGLITPDGGSVRVGGLDPARRQGPLRRRTARAVQMVFQDPYSSLNPRMRVGASVMEPLMSGLGLTRRLARARTVEMLERVGMPGSVFDRYPHEFSGGQRQRLAIARALVLSPQVVILDEAVSALDVSIKSQILNLLNDLQRDLSSAFVFISHDLALSRQFCRRIAVMLEGRIVETGPAEELLRAPRHPYTQLLIRSIPRRAGGLPFDGGPAGRPGTPPAFAGGCRFVSRCPIALARCRTERPPLAEVGAGHGVACHAVGEPELTTGGGL
jgi:oligopeptide/dipeptide ABC transporter ATP-binding protein